ncbi:hypothetical protein WJX74_004147 [Apatococcus lobatus]|uniref:Uncharacterized protein n=1 Tax=Apatococcus lobatus TaxID=904363 RepID=A0AAW1RFL7_9CHLO
MGALLLQLEEPASRSRLVLNGLRSASLQRNTSHVREADVSAWTSEPLSSLQRYKSLQQSPQLHKRQHVCFRLSSISLADVAPMAEPGSEANGSSSTSPGPGGGRNSEWPLQPPARSTASGSLSLRCVTHANWHHMPFVPALTIGNMWLTAPPNWSAALPAETEEVKRHDARLYTDQQQAHADLMQRKAEHAQASGNAEAATSPAVTSTRAEPQAALAPEPGRTDGSAKQGPLGFFRQHWGRMHSRFPDKLDKQGNPVPIRPAPKISDKVRGAEAAARPQTKVPAAAAEDGPLHPAANAGQARLQTLADLLGRQDPTWAPIDLASGVFMSWWLAFTGIKLMSPKPELLEHLRKAHPVPEWTEAAMPTSHQPLAQLQEAEDDESNELPMVLEALPAEGIPTTEPSSPDLLVFTVPGLAISMPTALGSGRYLPIFLSERQRDAALEAGARMMLGNHMAVLQELRQMRCLVAVTRATNWAGKYVKMKPGEAEAAADEGGTNGEEKALLQEMGLASPSEKGSTIGLSWSPLGILATLACGFLCTAAYARQQAHAFFDTRVRRPAFARKLYTTAHCMAGPAVPLTSMCHAVGCWNGSLEPFAATEDPPQQTPPTPSLTHRENSKETNSNGASDPSHPIGSNHPTGSKPAGSTPPGGSHDNPRNAAPSSDTSPPGHQQHEMKSASGSSSQDQFLPSGGFVSSTAGGRLSDDVKDELRRKMGAALKEVVGQAKLNRVWEVYAKTAGGSLGIAATVHALAMAALGSNPMILPTHIVKMLSYRTLKPLESQRAAIAAGKPAHIIHNSTTHQSLPKGFLQDPVYTVLDAPALGAPPLPHKTELGLVANSSLKFAAQVGTGPNDQQERLELDPEKGGQTESLAAQPQEKAASTEWMGAEDGHKDREGMSLAHKRQLTIGASWSVPDTLCTEADAMEIVLQGMDPVSHAGLLLVGDMQSMLPSHSSSFGVANLSFLLKLPPQPFEPLDHA